MRPSIRKPSPERPMLATISPLTVCLVLFVGFSEAHAIEQEMIWVDQSSQASTQDGSTKSPFRTIAAAARHAKPNSTIVVRQGIYRESVLLPQGLDEQPITLRSAEGHRVIMSGLRPITDWHSTDENVFKTLLPKQSSRLFRKGLPLPLAKTPDEGWWTFEDVNGSAISDRRLKTVFDDIAGSTIFIWHQRGNTQSVQQIKEFERETGRIVLAAKTTLKLQIGDRYQLQNHPHHLTRSGEWARGRDGAAYCFLAENPDGNTSLEHDDLAVLLKMNSHTRVDGIDFVGAVQNAIEVTNCKDVRLDRIRVTHAGQRGLYVRDSGEVIVKGSRFSRSRFGINFYGTSGFRVEECEISHNLEDGLRITHGSHDGVIQKNFIHHHLQWGHPDAIQMFADVSNVMIKDNVMLANGQSVMAEASRDVRLINNLLVGATGSHVMMLHGNTERVIIDNNTIALCGLQSLRVDGKDYLVRKNVFVTGHPNINVNIQPEYRYMGADNVFWNSSRAKTPTIAITDDVRHRSGLSLSASGYEKSPRVIDPRFINAPIAFTTASSTGSRRDQLQCRKYAELFSVGDRMEVDFDGVVRKINGIDGNTIQFSPALSTQPLSSVQVINWANQSSIRMNYRTKDSSTGSRLDFQSYAAGDFNGDGASELPPQIPPQLHTSF